MLHQFRALRSRTILPLAASLALALAGLVSVSAQSAAAGSAAAKSSPPSLSAGERVEVFEEVWKTIDKRYYDPSFNGVDWAAVRGRYRPLVEASADEEEFYDLLNRMAGELRDAHTRVRSPRQNRDRRKQEATTAGVIIFEVEGTPVVFDVTPDSEAARAGVLPGMTVRTVGGRPVAEALAQARAEVGPSSSERAARVLSYLRLIAGAPGSTLELGLARADGTPLDLRLTRRTVSAAPRFDARLLPSGHAYVRFDRFRPPVGSRLKEALAKFKDAPGLILDLRANGGGDGREGLRVAGYFFDEKVSVARVVTRTGKPPSALFGLVSLPKVFEAGGKGGRLYTHPVVVLVNEGTGSTAELIANGLQEQGRAYVVGTRSCGCVLGVLKHRELKGGGDLSVSEIGFVTPKGRRLEGEGVAPDKSVPVTLRDLRAGRDAALEEAEAYLKSRPGRGN
ncbi:MAG TPA: S41 family peptidase [Pyrinomonadaceae bacterium]|jgi:carboxyl-terminal processing protease